MKEKWTKKGVTLYTSSDRTKGSLLVLFLTNQSYPFKNDHPMSTLAYKTISSRQDVGYTRREPQWEGKH